MSDTKEAAHFYSSCHINMKKSCSTAMRDYVLQAAPSDDQKNECSHNATVPDLVNVPAIDYGEVMEKK
eukprot:14226577-Ditylum_brightwellii.AAC.1